MTYQDRFNSERYLDMTAFLAIRNIERSERRKSKLREDWDFRRGDLYMADLGFGALGHDGTHVQGGVRPVVLLQNNIGNFYAPTLVIVPITSKVWKKPDQPTHYLIRKTQGLTSDCLALGEQITTIDKRQCLKYLGRLSRKETDAIKEAAIEKELPSTKVKLEGIELGSEQEKIKMLEGILEATEKRLLYYIEKEKRGE